MKDKNLAFNLLALAAQLLLDDMDDCFVAKKACNKSTCCKNTKAVTPKTQPCNEFDFSREPDGVRIVVDRPRMEMFNGNRRKWALAMADYRTLIDQAKKCEAWETRVPNDVPNYVHANRRDWYEDHEDIHPFDVVSRHRNFGW